MMPATLQAHPSVCGFYTIYAAFHHFKFQQEEITEVHDGKVLSIKKITCNLLKLCIQMYSLYYVFVFFYAFYLTFSKYYTIFLHSIQSKQHPQA